MEITATVSVEDAATALGLRSPTVRKLIHAGRLIAKRTGKSWRITTQSINDLLPPAPTQPQPSPSAAPVHQAEPEVKPCSFMEAWVSTRRRNPHEEAGRRWLRQRQDDNGPPDRTDVRHWQLR